MKYQQFATYNFIGLKSVQKNFIRNNFTFREHKISLIQILYESINNIKAAINYIQNDY